MVPGIGRPVREAVLQGSRTGRPRRNLGYTKPLPAVWVTSWPYPCIDLNVLGVELRDASVVSRFTEECKGVLQVRTARGEGDQLHLVLTD